MAEEKKPRILPHSAEAERAVLGAMLRQEDMLASGLGQLNEPDFYLPANQLIYATMAELHNESHPVDEVTVVERLDLRHQLQQAGGVTYVTGLRQALPVLGNFEHYIAILKNKSTLRKLSAAASDIQSDVFGSGEELQTVLSHAEKLIFDISLQNTKRGLTRLEDSVARSFVAIGDRAGQSGLTGLPTGFIDLDQKLSGLQKSDLIVVAGRPAMGKTSFAINIAQHAATREQAVVAVFSLEMATDQLSTRMLCTEARVDMQRVKTGTVTDEDWVKLGEAMTVLARANMYIDDTAGISLAEMRSKLRRLKLEKNQLDLVVIDYLQLMTYHGKADNRQQEISDTTRQLKIMARDLDVPILLLSQLSRGPESRTNKRPMMSDLRESGAIEQDADIVILLYRSAVYDEEDDSNIAQAIVAKHRNGPTGDVDLFWRGEYTLFENYSGDSPADAPW